MAIDFSKYQVGGVKSQPTTKTAPVVTSGNNKVTTGSTGGIDFSKYQVKQAVSFPKQEEKQKQEQNFFSKVKSYISSFGSEAYRSAKPAIQQVASTATALPVLINQLPVPQLSQEKAVDIYRKVTGQKPITEKQRQYLKESVKASEKKYDDFFIRLSNINQAKVQDFYTNNPLEVETLNKPFIEKVKDPKWVARGLTMNLPSLAITTVAGVTTGGVGAVATGLLMESGSFYQEALSNGVDKKDAVNASLGYGALAGVLESLVPGEWGESKLITNAVKGNLKKEIVRLVKDSALEGVTETGQEILSNAFKTTYKKDQSLFEGVGEAGFFGFLLGLGGSGTISVTNKGLVRVTGVKIDEKGLSDDNEAIITPEKAISTVVSSKAKDTTEGKTIIKTALEAQNSGKDLKITQTPQGTITTEVVDKGTIKKEPILATTEVLPEVKVAQKELYRGSKGEVVKETKDFDKVLVVKNNQAELIKQLADEGNQKAKDLYESLPNKNRVDFTIADPIIKEAFGDRYDAIQYNNQQAKAIGKEYHDLSSNKFYAENEATAKLYSMQKREDKYKGAEVKKTTKESLLEEARKYKSAEEFVQSQSPVYHGSFSKLENFEKGNAEGRRPGIYFSPLKEVGERYSNTLKGKGKNYERYLNVNKPKELTRYIDSGTIQKEDVQKAIKDGYDSFHYKPKQGEPAYMEEWFVFNPSTIKTKQQLTDIYNQATKEQIKVETKPQVSKNALGEYYAKADQEKVGQAWYEVMSEMDVAEAGQRIFNQDGEFTGAISSTFPEWIPEELRNKKLFDSVMAGLADPANIQFPPNSQPRKQALYEAILSEIDSRAGLDSSDIIQQIKDQYAKEATQKTKAKEQPKEVATRSVEGSKTTAEPKVKASKVAVSIEQKLGQQLENIAGFESINVKEQAKKASELVTRDLNKTRDIIAGKKQLPSDVRGSAFIKAVEEYAQQTGDISLLRSLAISPLVAETSIHAQELRLLAERDENSVLTKIQDLANERAKIFEKKSKIKADKAINEEVKKIKEEVKKAKTYDWQNFLKSIEC